jgi:two-component system chemotaxis response regulator CheB
VVDKIKVAVVDDSLFIRTILSDMLSTDPELEIIGTAKDGIEAVELVGRKKIDVVTMDVVMPRSDGLQALEKIMKLPDNPAVVMLSAADRSSADTVMRSLELGAFDFVMKPASTSSTHILRLKWEIISKIKAAHRAGGRRALETEEEVLKMPVMKDLSQPIRKSSGRIIAIGSSTGGPVALRYILQSMPAHLPAPIVIAQHMPKAFTESFSERLGKKCKIKVVESKEDELLRDGCAYIAPGDSHMRILYENGKLKATMEEGDRIRGGRPSVDILLTSVAEASGENAIGVILTGMGGDGARGIKSIKDAGGHTIAQDESTSLVWSMPRSAIRLGVVDQVLPLDQIPRALLSDIGVGS